MDKTKTQEKFLKLLDLLNGCREKLYATYNLFVSNLEHTKEIKKDINAKYEQLLDLNSERIQLIKSNKPAKTRTAKIIKESSNLKAECDEQISNVGAGMSDCENCRKTYKHEVALCCQTYNALKEKTDTSSIEKGYKQQVKMIRRILEKIDTVKVNFKSVKEEIKNLKKMFDELYNKITGQELALA